MGLIKNVFKGALISLVLWGGCNYLQKRVDNTDSKLETRVFTDYEKQQLRAVMNQNPRIMADSFQLAAEEGYATEIVKQIPRGKMTRMLNEGLSLEEKVYMTGEFARYEIGRLLGTVYEKIDNRRER